MARSALAFIYRNRIRREERSMEEGKRAPWRVKFEIRDTPYDLAACALLALILVALVFYAPDNIVRQIIGLVFVLFLPGYAATAALFPENDQIDGIERVALSFGLSIAIVPLIGLGLNFTPWGIRLDPILASVSAFIIAASLVGWYRRMRLPSDERFAISVNLELDFGGMPLIDKILTIGIVVMLVASVVVLAWAVATPRVGERFTQLAILGPGGMATDYPRNLTIGQEATVLLSVKSFEHQVSTYTMAIILTSATDNTTSVDSYSVDWNQTHPLTPFHAIAQNFTLNHLEYYNTTFEFSVTSPGTWKLQFILMIGDEPVSQDSYREVHLWLNVT